jgi:hypothetical protein
MISRNSFASLLVACVLAAGFQRVAPVADAASVGPHLLKVGESGTNNVIEIKGRGRGRSPRLYVPIVPYIAYDYPYYYSRGHYPTSIGRGYVYYGYPYSHYVSIYNARHGGQCSDGSRRCLAKWGRNRGPASPRRRPY